MFKEVTERENQTEKIVFLRDSGIVVLNGRRTYIL